MPSFSLTSERYFIDALDDGDAVSVCEIKRDWDEYFTMSDWFHSIVSYLLTPSRRPPAGEVHELVVYGVSIRGAKLQELAKDLHRYQCRVNRDGFCYMLRRERGTYHRLNDLFPWSTYGVQPAAVTIWNRIDLASHETVVDHDAMFEAAAENKNSIKSINGFSSPQDDNTIMKVKLAEKEEEAEAWKKVAEEKQKAADEAAEKLKKMGAELFATKKQNDALRVSVGSLVHSVGDLNVVLQQDLFRGMLPEAEAAAVAAPSVENMF